MKYWLDNRKTTSCNCLSPEIRWYRFQFPESNRCRARILELILYTVLVKGTAAHALLYHVFSLALQPAASYRKLAFHWERIYPSCESRVQRCSFNGLCVYCILFVYVSDSNYSYTFAIRWLITMPRNECPHTWLQLEMIAWNILSLSRIRSEIIGFGCNSNPRSVREKMKRKSARGAYGCFAATRSLSLCFFSLLFRKFSFSYCRQCDALRNWT